MLGESGPEHHAAAVADPARAHLVLDDGAGLSGYLSLAAPRGPEPGVELHRLVVAADRRRTGLGHALLHLALDLCGLPRAPEGPSGSAPESAARGNGTGTGAGAGTGTGAGKHSGDAGVVLDPGWTPPGWLAAGRIWLEVAPGNTAALRLYRAAGFVTETQLPSVPGDPTSPPLRLILSRG